MIESLMLLAVISSAVYAVIALEAHKILLWASSIILLLFSTLQLTYFIKLFFWTYFKWNGPVVILSVATGCLLLLTFIFYKAVKVLGRWIKESTLTELSIWISSIFLATSFTLIYAYFLRFLADSGLISPSYANHSLPMKILLQFCIVGDYTYDLILDFGESLLNISSEAFREEAPKSSL